MLKSKSNLLKSSKIPQYKESRKSHVFSAIEWTTCELGTNLTSLDYLESSRSTNLSTELAKLGQCLFVFRCLTNIMTVRVGKREREWDKRRGEQEGVRQTPVKQRSMTRAEEEISFWWNHDTIVSIFSFFPSPSTRVFSWLIIVRGWMEKIGDTEGGGKGYKRKRKKIGEERGEERRIEGRRIDLVRPSLRP